MRGLMTRIKLWYQLRRRPTEGEVFLQRLKFVLHPLMNKYTVMNLDEYESADVKRLTSHIYSDLQGVINKFETGMALTERHRKEIENGLCSLALKNTQ